MVYHIVKKFTLLERLMSPEYVCKSYKGLVSPKNRVIGAYVYCSRGVSPRNIVVGAFLDEQKTNDSAQTDMESN
jgi:hypothetical protein